jgi:CheY-like chemotaxis protein
MDDYVSKPVQITHLETVLQRAMNATLQNVAS